jgi:AsmA-like C-terminal region
LGGATLAGRLHLATARVHSRTLSDLESAWSLVRSADGMGRLSLAEKHAAIYGGALTGHVELLLGPDRTDYDLTAMVHGMQIAPWLQAGRNGVSAPSIAASADTETQVRGTADAQLYLSGVIGDPLSRRGGGQLDVRDGYIYRLPILLAILNVLDMSVPNDEALHELEADFFVLGNRLQLDAIALHGGSLNLVGSGSMSLPDQAVDLRLVNVGTRPWARVPLLTDLVDSAMKEFVELRVTGPVSRPTVRAQPLRGLSEEFKRLFQKKPPKKTVREGP